MFVTLSGTSFEACTVNECISRGDYDVVDLLQIQACGEAVCILILSLCYQEQCWEETHSRWGVIRSLMEAHRANGPQQQTCLIRIECEI